jgi:hypothetical protein
VGTAARVVGGLVFVLFVSVIALRPLVANPAVAGAIRDGLDGWQLLAVLPLVLVTVVVVALRLRSLTGDPEEDHAPTVAGTGNRETFWDARKAGAEPADSRGSDTGESTAERTATASGESGSSTDGQTASGSTGGPAEQPNLLGGQGGTRDREFDIEEEPPDATLSEHLDHLQAELDEEEEIAQDLRTLEEVAAEVEGDRTIPARCPQSHCDAVWTGRTVLGIGTDRYELLEDGTRVQCLNCEEIHSLESEGDRYGSE